MIRKLIGSAVILCAAIIAHAQVPVQPILQPHQAFVDGSGSPCAGCSLYTYLAGTTTASPTYTSSAGSSQNTNPIVLDVTGSAQIWTASAISYKFVLKDAGGTTLWTVDNVHGSCTSGGCTFTGPLQIESSIYIADGSMPASVLAFGAKCDGATDDTVNIQAAITWEAAHFGTLTFPSGTCNISDSLVIPLTQKLRLSGQSRLGTIIKMTVDNKPILVANTSLTHSIELDHMTLAWSNAQTTSDPLSYGIQWTGGGGSSFFRWHVHDFQIDRPFIGLGIKSSGGASETVWNMTVEDTIVTQAAQNCVALVPAVAAGMPVNVFKNFSCNNTGGGPTPAGPALYLSAAETQITGLDVEGWYNEAIWSTGGGFVNVEGCHVEHHNLPTSGGRFFFMANGPMSINGCQLAMDGTPALSNAQIAGEGSGATLTLHNINAFMAPIGGSTLYWTTGNIAHSLDFLNLIDEVGTSFTSPIGVVPLSAIASWPDVFPFLRQNQSAPQLVQMSGTNGSTAAYSMNLGPDVFTPGTVYYHDAGSNNWHVTWVYIDGSSTLHYQKCTDVAGTSAGPATTAPSGCTDEFTVDGSGNVKAFGAFVNANGTVIPAAATGSTGSGNVVLSTSPTLTTPVLGTAAFTSLTNGGNTVPVVGAPAAGQAACIKSAGPPVVVGVCSTVVGAGGACTCN